MIVWIDTETFIWSVGVVRIYLSSFWFRLFQMLFIQMHQNVFNFLENSHQNLQAVITKKNK